MFKKIINYFTKDQFKKLLKDQEINKEIDYKIRLSFAGRYENCLVIQYSLNGGKIWTDFQVYLHPAISTQLPGMRSWAFYWSGPITENILKDELDSVNTYEKFLAFQQTQKDIFHKRSSEFYAELKQRDRSLTELNNKLFQ